MANEKDNFHRLKVALDTERIRSREAIDRVWLNLEGVQSTGEPFAVIPKYFATFNEHVARLIPEAAKRILDVGCGAGLFLKKLKSERVCVVQPHAHALVVHGHVHKSTK